MTASAFGGDFVATSVVRTGSFELDREPDAAFHLFTAPGETLWVPGWDPVVLSGDGLEQGTVFITEHDNERTTWIVIEYDPEAYRARYARLTPESRVGTVEVALSSSSSGGSVVNVTYELTGLSDSGNHILDAFDDSEYAEMLREWKTLIEAADIDYDELQRDRLER